MNNPAIQKLKVVLSPKNFEIRLTGIFLATQFFVVRAHEMWRDEIQAWLFARDSTSLWNLAHNLRYEGHPPLWHSLLFLLARFTDNPVAMQVLHSLIAAAAVFLFARYAPFNKIYKTMFAFSYLMFYEYGVIARNYNLMVLLIIIFCVLVTRRRKNYIAIGFNLMLLTQVHAIGVLLLPALVGYVAWDFFTVKNKKPAEVKKFFVGGALLAIGLIAFAIETKVPSDGYFPMFRVADLRNAVASVWWGMGPIPAGVVNFWSTNHLMLIDQAALAAIVLLILTTLYFSRHIKMLVVYFLGVTPLVGFFYFKSMSSVRSHGLIFIVFLFCAWLSKQESRNNELITRGFRVYQNLLLGSVLAIQLFAGFLAVKTEFKYTFSRGEMTASYIKQQGLDKLPIVGMVDYQTSTLLGFLNTKAYYVQSDVWGSFVVWNKHRATHPVTPQNAVDAAYRVAQAKNSDVLLVTQQPLDMENAKRVKFLKEFTGPSVVLDEVYFLYLAPQAK